jgi:hypothetical protein
MKKQESAGGKMKITDFWNMSILLDKISQARGNLQQSPEKCFVCKDGNAACLVDAIAPPSYHQTREIAEIFGLDYDELLMNEKEMDAFRELLSLRLKELLTNLNQRVLAPGGYFFSFGHDPEGRFGLLLHCRLSSGREEESPRKTFFLPRWVDPSEAAG